MAACVATRLRAGSSAASASTRASTTAAAATLRASSKASDACARVSSASTLWPWLQASSPPASRSSARSSSSSFSSPAPPPAPQWSRGRFALPPTLPAAFPAASPSSSSPASSAVALAASCTTGSNVFSTRRVGGSASRADARSTSGFLGKKSDAPPAPPVAPAAAEPGGGECAVSPPNSSSRPSGARSVTVAAGAHPFRGLSSPHAVSRSRTGPRAAHPAGPKRWRSRASRLRWHASRSAQSSPEVGQGTPAGDAPPLS